VESSQSNLECGFKMKIKFVQTGGFAGLTKEAEIDTGTISTDEKSVLQKAIEDSDFFNIQTQDSEPMPDAEQFYITVEQEGKSHMVGFNMMNVPEKLKPLVDNLKKQAKVKQF
jgi:hypothetical protein